MRVIRSSWRGGLVGLHATDPVTVYLSAWARAKDLSVAQLERALYEERSLLRMIGMRRTLFVLPLDLAAVVKAACTESIAEAQRRRYAKLIEEGGIASNGLAWLEDAADATVRALESRGQAFASELSAEVPQLREKLSFGEGKTWAGTIGMTTWVLFLLAAEGRIVRGRPRGTWTSSQWSWIPAEAWSSEPLPRARAGGGAGRARVPLAGRLRAGDGHRPQVVDRVDARADPQRRLPRSVSRRSTSTACPGSPFPTISRASRTRAVGRVAAGARSDRDGLEGA